MPRHDKDLLKASLTVEDIEKLLYELGSENVIPNKSNSGLITNTICHNTSSGNMKLYYYPHDEYPQFTCYTGCSCSMDIFELVRRNYSLRNIELSFADTVNWVAERSGRSFGFGFSVDIEDSTSSGDMEWLMRFEKRKPIEYQPLEEYSDRLLDVFEDYHHPSFITDNISHDAMSKFDIKFYAKTNSVIIPHRGINGKLLGVRSRNLNEWEVSQGFKYVPTKIQGKTYSFPTQQSLFGLYQNRKTIQRLRKAILFESEKSILQCENYFPNNNFSVALSGRNISQLQIDLLLEQGIEEIIIATDKMFEENGTRMEEEDIKFITRLGRRFAPYIRVYTLFDTEGLIEYRESPSDFGIETLIHMMKNKQEILNIE